MAEAAAEAVVVVVVVVAASFRLNSLPRSHGTRLSEQQQGKARCEGEEVESNEKLCLPFVSFPFFFCGKVVSQFQTKQGSGMLVENFNKTSSAHTI